MKERAVPTSTVPTRKATRRKPSRKIERLALIVSRGGFMKFGGFWIRVLAYLIDFVVLLVGQTILLSIFGNSSIGSTSATGFAAQANTDDPVLTIVLFVLVVLYFAGFESSGKQATPGKMALGLIVTNGQGGRISFLRALGRYFAKILSTLILFIGFIMVAFTDKKQGLHDLLASTLVVKGKPGRVGYDPETFE
ncbi:MAG: RDD family protein [Erythrobacter sp.]